MCYHRRCETLRAASFLVIPNGLLARVLAIAKYRSLAYFGSCLTDSMCVLSQHICDKVNSQLIRKRSVSRHSRVVGDKKKENARSQGDTYLKIYAQNSLFLNTMMFFMC